LLKTPLIRPSPKPFLVYSFMELKIHKNNIQEIRACAPCIGKPQPVAFSSYFPCAACKPPQARMAADLCLLVTEDDVLIFVGSNQTCLASGQSAGHRRWQPAKEPCHENPLSPPAHPLLAGLLSALPLAALAASPT
jgi:hypothetical protein